MEPKLVSEMTMDELKELIKQAFIDGMREVNRQQSTARADKVAKDLQLLNG